MAHQYKQQLCLGKEKYTVLNNLITKIQEKTNNKLYGLEVFHSTSFHGKAANILFALCKEHNLCMSGGSDYHGKDAHNKFIGKVFPKSFNDTRITLILSHKDISKAASILKKIQLT